MIPKEVQRYIRGNFRRGKVVCLTGAGISAESGIPTFRGKGGLWEKYDPERYANAEGLISILRSQPQKLINFIVDFYSVILKARPNPAHLTLSALEKEGILDCIITQNVDNLHQAAGARNVIELHGNAFRIRCTDCQKVITLERDRVKEMIKLFGTSFNSQIKLLRILSRYFPRCKCGSRYRIDIVLFGEMLPQDELAGAYKYLDSCRALLLIGTSLVVYPAASLPLYAKERGATLIEINSQKSAFSDLCNYSIIGQASQIMPEILETLGS